MIDLTRLVKRWTTIPLVGMDLGSRMLKVVELGQSGGQIILRRAAVKEVEKNNSTNFLRGVLRDAGIATNQVALGLASPEVVARSFQFPHMPKKEFDNALRIEAEQAVLNGHSLDEVEIDWHLFSSDSSELMRGLLAVVPKALIADRIQKFKTGGLEPRVVDIEGLALWNAYWVLVGREESISKTVFLINLGIQTTNLVITKGSNELILMRDLQLGSWAIEKGREKEWIAEIRDSLGYARSKSGLRNLDAVYVTGGGNGSEIISPLKSIMHAPIELWNPLDDILCDSTTFQLEHAAGALLTLAIGLALRQPS